MTAVGQSLRKTYPLLDVTKPQFRQRLALLLGVAIGIVGPPEVQSQQAYTNSNKAGLPVTMILPVQRGTVSTPPQQIISNNWKLPLRVIGGKLYDFSPVMLVSLRRGSEMAGLTPWDNDLGDRENTGLPFAFPIGWFDDQRSNFRCYGMVRSVSTNTVSLLVGNLRLVVRDEQSVAECYAYFGKGFGHIVTRCIPEFHTITITNLHLPRATVSQAIEVFALPTMMHGIFDFGNPVTNKAGFAEVLMVEPKFLRKVPIKQ